jgi:hypothetical protein
MEFLVNDFFLPEKPKKADKKRSWGAEDPNLEVKKRFASGKVAFSWEGNDVYKFGMDKFVCLRLNDKSQLEGLIGEFVLDAEGKQWVPGAKVVTLDGSQLIALFGLILNKQTDHYRHACASSGHLSSMYNLGSDLYFGWHSWEKAPIANIRVYIKDKETGDLRSTNRGISMGVRSWESFRTSVLDETLIKKAKVVQQKSVKPTVAVEPDFSKLLAKLPKIMHADWMLRVQETCELCVQMRMLCEEPVHRDSGHTCHLGQENVSLAAGVAYEILKQLRTSNKVKGKWEVRFAFSSQPIFSPHRSADVHEAVGRGNRFHQCRQL